MMPFLTEIMELAIAAVVLTAAMPIFKKSASIPSRNILTLEAR